MSHFSVLVIGEDVDHELAPFIEGVSEGDEFAVFKDMTDIYEKEYNEGTWELAKVPNNMVLSLRESGKNSYVVDGDLYLTTWHEVFRKPGSFGIGSDSHEVPTSFQRIQVPFNKVYATLEDFVSDYHGGEKGWNGRYGYWHNPNARWDWYQVGGRWSQFIKVKSEVDSEFDINNRSWTKKNEPVKFGWVDSARLKDIDFDGMENEADTEARELYKNIEKVFGGTIPKLTILWKRDVMPVLGKEGHKEMVEKYHAQEGMKALAEARKSGSKYINFFTSLDDFQCTEDEFAQRARDNVFTPYAMVKDRTWYAKGDMGWWGISTNENENWSKEFKEHLKSLDPNTKITMVDCHI